MATPRALVNSSSSGPLSAIVGKLVKEWATFDSLKSSLFFYVLATNLLKAYRHVLARGLIATLNEGRAAVAQVRPRPCVTLSVPGCPRR